MKHRTPVSFDANAAAPVLPQAWDAYVEGMRAFADPAAPHGAGRAARAAWERAREEVAAAIGAGPGEIVFTSGGTESDAWALLGSIEAMNSEGAGSAGDPRASAPAAGQQIAKQAAAAGKPRVVTSATEHAAGEQTAKQAAWAGKPHVVTSAIEHAAVQQTLALAAKRGRATVHAVPVPRSGSPKVEDVLPHLTAATRLVSWVAASNETGVVQPVAGLAAACRARKIVFHTDAVQAMGRMAVDVRAWDVDLLAFSGHKLGAVGGVGVLYRRAGIPLEPLLPGGDEVPNVPGAMSLAAALRALPSASELQRLRTLRDGLERTVCAALPDTEVVGAAAERLPNTSCLRFPGCQGDGLLMALDIAGFAVSTGSACSSGSVEPSAILLGMGFTPAEALETLRISLPRDTLERDVEALGENLIRVVRASRT